MKLQMLAWLLSMGILDLVALDTVNSLSGVTTVIPPQPAIKIELKYLDKVPIPTDPPVGPTHSLGFASFFGESYIRLPYEDATSQTDIRVQFKTHRSHGLILAAAGRTDYCIIELINGRLEVRLELGSGEAKVTSPPGIRFDDLNWHYLSLQRINEDIILTTDGMYTTRVSTPGRFFELNIHYGIFLGGLGTFTDLNIKYTNFRGCMRYALYNSVDLFSAARQQDNPLNVYDVAWDCSDEFDATSDHPISFVNDDSYVAFPHLRVGEEWKLIFEIKSRTDDGLVLFTAAQHPTPDFVALEIVDGKLKLTIDKGSGPEHLTSDRNVNDGIWHRITIAVTVLTMDINIDGSVKLKRTSFGSQRYLDLHIGGRVYLGGIGSKSRVHAVRKNLVSLQGRRASKGSIQGCIRNIVYNNRPHGLREAIVTHAVKSNCVWKYPCVSNPCIRGAVCVEEGYDSYDCKCNKDMCFKPQGTGEAMPGELVRLNPLYIEEGAQAPITTNNIDFVFNYHSYGLLESAIVFTIITRPENGLVNIDVPGRQDPNMFTLQDLIADKVQYSHDGSESLRDRVEFSLEIIGHQELLPESIEKPKFTLAIGIIPKNDLPIIELPKDDTITIIQYSKFLITTKTIHAMDGDDNPGNLKFLIEYEGGMDGGYFERVTGPAVPLTSFTQQEVNQRIIVYANQGATIQRVRLRVTDGTDTSEARILKINSVDIKLTLDTNTGILMMPGRPAVFTAQNLSFSTNMPERNLEIRYRLMNEPKYGQIEQQRYSDSEWEVTNTFSQRHVTNEQVRYVQTDMQAKPTEDRFKFVVTCMNARSPEYEVLIEYYHSGVDVNINEQLMLNAVASGVITPQYLSVQTKGNDSPEEILYTLIEPPRYGLLSIMRNTSTSSVKETIQRNSRFTQRDINRGELIYSLPSVSEYAFDDEFQFKVFAPSVQSDISTFKIIYEPARTQMQVINKGLQNLNEGHRGQISHEDLYIESIGNNNYQFGVIMFPKHGVLQMIDPTTDQIMNSNVTMFTNQDIRDGKLWYEHDDSESRTDSFDYEAMPMLVTAEPEQEVSELTGTFKIKITLRNDNAPVRIVRKVFNVVANRGRLMTDKDLKYDDPDISFNDGDLEYAWRGIPNGVLVDANNHSHKITNFYQRDLENGKLYFIHKGESYGRSQIWVQDEDYYTSGLFEVRASQPYIIVVNNTGLEVQKGGEVMITSYNISIETNLDVDDAEVRFVLATLPQYGRILVRSHEKTEFNLAELKHNQVYYQHHPYGKADDVFEFYIMIENVQIKDKIRVSVFMDNMHHPPRVVNNKILVVSEGGSSYIDKTKLKVSHVDSLPSNIKYNIVQPPMYGDLHLKREGDIDNPEVIQRATSFTQSDINNDRLTYVQKQSGKATDQFTFDVTNGKQVLQGLEFVIEIIPATIPIMINNFTVEEGGKKTLHSDLIRITDEHFAKNHIIFSIIKAPLHGWIEHKDNPGSYLTRFTSDQLRSERISYVHDHNETLSDQFTILAMSRSQRKQSNPHTIYVHIYPVNDEPPEVVINTPLKVWLRSVTVITRDNLLTVDKDTKPEELWYTISPPTPGHVALLAKPDKEISNFTQAMIDAQQVVFVHSGESKGHFTFHVLDGATSTKRHRFVIKAQQLILELKRNKHIDVFPTTIQTITADNLLAVTNDVNQSRPIMYTLQRKPKSGRLVNRHNRKIELETFTQEDINRGNVGYLQSENVGSWKGKDHFMFEIQTAFANSITYRKFEIHISYETVKGDNINQLIGMSMAHVEEGGTVTFTKQNLNITNLMVLLQNIGILNPHVRYVIRELPQHGELLFDGQTITVGTNFLQQDVNEQRMKYMHDDSDSLMDSFKFMILVGTSDLDPDMTKIHDHDDIVFNVTVRPINDEEFELVTRNPSMTVLQGSTSHITGKELEVIDPDTGPVEIVFHIINGPTNGFLAKTDALNRPVTQFTQEDLNLKHLMFIHNGGQEEGSFYFKVTDGKFNDVYKVFKIFITPLTLEVKSSNVQLMQGQTSIVFTPNDIESSTNGKREEVKFNITKVPQFGKVFVNDVPSRHFAQLDVDSQQVVYVQTDLSVSMDAFELSAYNSKLVSPYHKVNITVKPFVKQKPFNVSFAESTPLTTEVLDATELATLTGSNPWYEITKHPMYGKFSRQRTKRDTSGRRKKGQLQSFTHEDILNRQIVFEAAESPGGVQKADDGFTYILHADSAQPAQGKLAIAMQPPKPKPNNGQTNANTGGGDNQTQNPQNTVRPPKVETKSPPGTSVLKRDHLLILFVVVGLVVVALVILVLIKCIHKPSPSKTPRVHDKSNMPQSAFDQSSSRDGTLDRVAPSYNSLPSIKVTQDTLPHDQRQQTLSPIQSLAAARTYSPTDSSLASSAASGDQTTRKVPARGPPAYDQDETEVKRPLPPGARGRGRTRGAPGGEGPSGSLNEHVTFDWESCDPELLQHVRTTNPVLKDSKYWV